MLVWVIASACAHVVCSGHSRRAQAATADEGISSGPDENKVLKSLATYLLFSGNQGLTRQTLAARTKGKHHGHFGQIGLAFPRKIVRYSDVKALRDPDSFSEVDETAEALTQALVDAQNQTRAPKKMIIPGAVIFVTVEIKPDRVEDFLVAIQEDVTKSRRSEFDPGCLRFDLMQDRDNPNKYYFYEVYIDDAAVAFHKTTSHYDAWAEFKKSGGVVSQEVVKAAADNIPGTWAYQRGNKLISMFSDAARAAVFVDVVIKEDRVDDFLKVIQDDVVNTRLEAKSFRFDLLRDKEQPNRFFFYEVYENDEALDFHKTTDHYKSWADFVESGGVESKAPTIRMATDTIEGIWAWTT